MNYEKILSEVHSNAPLVQCITNFVTVNDCANIILASGGSPSMAQDVREADEAVAGADALVCNMGAIDFVDSMISAGKRANDLNISVVLDPVAAGGTQLRRDAIKQLLNEVQFAVIRGNASEIRFIAGEQSQSSGVDVGSSDVITEDNLEAAVKTVEALASSTGAVIAISGAIDIISDGHKTVLLRNGCATMSRITGSGCMVTSLIGAFCGAAKDKPLDAAVAAMASMGICGEMAEEKRILNKTGNATFRTDLIDSIFNLTEKDLVEKIRYEKL